MVRLAIESKRVRTELASELHLLGCLLEFLGDVSKEEERPRHCDGKQLWEVTGRSGAQVKAHRRGIFELVTDVQRVVFFGDVAVDGLGVGLVLLSRFGDLLVDRSELIQLAGLRGPEARRKYWDSLSEEEREAARAKRKARQEKQRDDDAQEQNQP